MSIWLTTKETVDRQTTNLLREPSSSNLLEMAKDRHGVPHLLLVGLCTGSANNILGRGVEGGGYGDGGGSKIKLGKCDRW
jgi:hypothetical protein